MKKIIVALLAIVICLSFCGCGKSEAVIAYEELINAIGEISIDSEKALSDAEKAYKALTDEEKETVQESKAIYDAGMEKLEALKVAEIINNIGEVDRDSLDAIMKAEQKYRALSEEQKAMIADSGKVLSDAREHYDSVITKEMADEVIAKISEIGTVTLDSEEIIKEAKTLYNNLSSEGKKLVDNYNVLESAESELKALVEAEREKVIKNASKNFNIKYDKVENLTWYNHKNIPKYIDTRCYIIPYIGIRGSNPWIVIRYNYTGDSWVFWESMKIVSDGEIYYKSPYYYDIVHDNDSEVWEVWDEVLDAGAKMDDYSIQMLYQIAYSEETIIRFQGDDYHHDYYVSQKDKNMIKDVLALYEALLG